ncbi:MAG: M48 family peptidase [Deltaproteobacteria bacterium]|nr:M48 family peptidase [Deltaproteobacteria bacterium]
MPSNTHSGRERIFMEKILIVVFLGLFCGRTALRYILQRLNLRNLALHGKEIPSVLAGSIDAGVLNKTVDYVSEQSRLETKENITHDMIELATVFLLLPSLLMWITGMHAHLVAQALIFFAVLFLISGAAGLPFDLYHTFVLEKKYGFSTITWKLWLADTAKSVLISAILMAIIIGTVMGFIILLPRSWWFWGWAFFTLFQIMMMWLYPVLIAPFFNKFEPIQDEALTEKITTLLARAGLETRGIYQVDEGKRSRHTNAYFTGIGRAKRIVLFDTLLSSHTHDEIASILAHEIGHWKGRHILKQLVFTMIISLLLFYIIYHVVNWPPLFNAFRINHNPVYAGFFLILLYLEVIGFYLSPIGAAVVRHFEREADRKAVELTGGAQPMINALKRLAKDNLSNLHPHRWYVCFYYSHPPLVDRIEYLQSLDCRRDKSGE